MSGNGTDGGGGGDNGSSVFMHRVKMEDLSRELCGLIFSVRDLEDRITQSAMTGMQFKEAFVEMFPPAVLFSSEINAMPVIYTNLRDWLYEKGANITPHSSRRVIMTLETSLYTESEDKEAATEISREIIASGRRSTRSVGTVTTSAVGRST